MIKITSILEKISIIAFEVKTLDQLSIAKTKITQELSESKVKDSDKKIMIKAINDQKSVLAFQKYICNALLKYEGLGINQIEKPLEKGEKPDTDSYEMNTDNIC